MEKHITFAEVVELILLFSLPVSFIGVTIQFFYLRYVVKLLTEKIILILISSQILCWIMTGIFCKYWPFETDIIMKGFICIPTIIGEFIILLTTFFVFNKKSNSWG
jgi:hypothetical protein